MKILFIIAAAVFFPVTASAQSILHSETTAPADVAQTIEAMVFEWADKFNRGDWKKIQDTWDMEDDGLSYLGEERDRWVSGRAGINSYFNPPAMVRSLMETVHIRPYRLRVRQVSDNIVIATWENNLDFKVRTRPAINDDYRVNAVFRKKPDGWRFIHYAELAMAPMTYMEHLYRKTVSPGFPESGLPYDGNWTPPEGMTIEGLE